MRYTIVISIEKEPSARLSSGGEGKMKAVWHQRGVRVPAARCVTEHVFLFSFFFHFRARRRRGGGEKGMWRWPVMCCACVCLFFILYVSDKEKVM